MKKGDTWFKQVKTKKHFTRRVSLNLSLVQWLKKKRCFWENDIVFERLHEMRGNRRNKQWSEKEMAKYYMEAQLTKWKIWPTGKYEHEIETKPKPKAIISLLLLLYIKDVFRCSKPHGTHIGHAHSTRHHHLALALSAQDEIPVHVRAPFGRRTQYPWHVLAEYP